MSFLNFLYSQFFITPQLPRASFTGQTIIVTGANVGLGLEAARHFVQLGASKLIIASRSSERGETAKRDIEKTTGRAGVVEVWPLDLQSYDSVKAFAERANRLDRLDAVCENAGIATRNFKLAEGDEATITVNVISTFLLALLILPALRKTATKHNITPRLVIVSSEVHMWAAFKERSAANIFDTCSDKSTANMEDRVSFLVGFVDELNMFAYFIVLVSSEQTPGGFRSPSACPEAVAKFRAASDP